jgi:NADH dehydrogenase [ubiquinone] 1 alpha subcomplex assembly factor 7
MSELDRLIKERQRQGPLAAAEFMALALYHPVHGYYRSPMGPWGFEGKDYYTALDVGPLLGQCICLRLEEVWRGLDRPQVFTVLEPGAGRGWLGRDLLEAAAGEFAAALRYIHQDDNPAAGRAAREALATHLAEGRARISSEAEQQEPFVGAVISNELFDALPAQPWRWNGAGWVREVLTESGPDWEAADPGEAGAWFESRSRSLQPGDGSSWCEGLPGLVHRLASGLSRGLFLAVDYGDSAEALLGKGADLRRFKEHKVDGRWSEAPGESDLTADVDFTRLQLLLEAEGLVDAQHQTLSRWIRDHAPLGRWEGEWQALPLRQRVERTQNLLQLTMPGMLGERFRVLEARKP